VGSFFSENPSIKSGLRRSPEQSNAPRGSPVFPHAVYANLAPGGDRGGFFVLVMIEIIVLVLVLLSLIGIGIFVRRAVFK
jgi:hypothetical protein